MEEKEVKDFIFTFGSGQIPGLGMFCRIKASSALEARIIMADRTRKYAFMYNSEKEAGVQKYGLTEIYWDPEFKGWSESPVNSGRKESEVAKCYVLFEDGEFLGTYTTLDRAKSDMTTEIVESCGQLTEDAFSIIESELNTTIQAVSRKVIL